MSGRRAHRHIFSAVPGRVPRLALLCLAMVISVAGAKTQNQFEFLGFSQDAAFLAFEEYAAPDEAGKVEARITFVEVTKNAWAATPVTRRRPVAAGETDEAAVARVRREVRLAADSQLTKLGIVPGNCGARAVAPPPDAPAPVGAVRFARQAEGAPEQRYELQLTQRPVEVPSLPVTSADPRRVFTLTLVNLQDQKSRVLQADKGLPKSRAGALDYRIRDVYLYRGCIAVSITVSRLGFEGMDVLHIMVTGPLP